MVRKSLVFLAAVVSSFPAFAGVRLLNTGNYDAQTVLHCGSERTSIALAAGEATDVADCPAFTLDGNPTIVALTTKNTPEGNEQRLLPSSATQETGCAPIIPILAPLNGCKSGTATVAVTPVPGATYAWTVTGATILNGAGTESLTLALGTTSAAVISVDITTPDCVSQGTAAIVLREPFSVRATAIDGHANEPVTINWTYTNGTPVTQTLTGSDFGPITLGPLERSYTYTPTTAGGKQATIDAVLQGAVLTPAPPSRRRAVTKTLVTASACTTAHATTHFDVTTAVCPQFTAQLAAPPTVLTGASFTLSVTPQTDVTATWTIVNGTPSSATGNSVTVTAGKAGPLNVKLRLQRGACSAEFVRTVEVLDKPVCQNPTAKVTLSTITCGSAEVDVAFMGTPPFQGTWSDGIPFTSSSVFMSRTVVAPGMYSISKFSDAACAGTATGSAAVPPLYPTATLTGKTNSCVGDDTVQIHLTGKAPFYLNLQDGTVTTSQTDITRSVTQTGAYVIYGSDATGCAMQTIGSITGQPHPTVYVYSYCAVGLPTPLEIVANVSGTSPTSVTWTNGATSPYLYVNPVTTQTYTVASARDAYCPALIDPAKATITIAPDASPDFNLSGAGLCAGVPHSVSLNTPPPPGAAVQWSINNGTILSGQYGTTMQYTTPYGATAISCTFTYAYGSRCPKTTTRSVQLSPGADGTINLSPSAMFVGRSITFSITVSGASSWSIDDSMGDTITTPAPCTSGVPCTQVYTSSHGTGLSTINLHFTNSCGDQKTVSALLTILP